MGNMSVELCMISKNTPDSYIHIDVFVLYDVRVPFIQCT